MAKAKKASKPTRRKQKPTKDETVETSNGVQLLLGNIVGQKDREYYADTFLKLQAKANTANASVREFKKKAKEAGVNVQSMLNVLKLEKMDALDLADLLKQEMAFIRDRGLPVQLSLYEPKYGSIQEQATKFGWDAGVNGRSPPVDMYPEGTPGHEEMMRSWNDAQKQIIEDGSKAGD